MIVTYVLAAERYDGWAKIGRTSRGSAHDRMMQCQIGNPHRLRVVAEWVGDLEPQLHAHFAGVRGSGEWFALPVATLADMAESQQLARGYVGVMVRWPVERILVLGDEGATADELADLFAPRAAHDPHTGRLRVAL